MKMKLIKVRKADSPASQKCDRYKDDILANISNSIALPNYIIKHSKGLNGTEANDLTDDLEFCLEQLGKLKKNLENAVKELRG